MEKKRVSFIDFIEKFYHLESGKPVTLEPWQRERIFGPVFNTLDDRGLRQYNTALVGLGKKNGKSEMASMVAAYMLLADGERDPEVYGAAGDKDQARIIFDRTKKAFMRSPGLRQEVKLYKDVIEAKGGGIYRVLSADAPTAHGLNASATIFDELWNQKSYDLWEALTHSPARKEPLHFIVTYSSYEPWDGALLWDLYQRGLEGDDPRLFMLWLSGDEANPASWVTDEYLGQQRRRLPEHIFKRLHLNLFTSGAGTFITLGDVQECTDPALSFKTDNRGAKVEDYYIALDLGLSRDKTVVTTVHRDQTTRKVIADAIKTFEPPPQGKVSIEAVEAYIRDTFYNFKRVRAILCDPWQTQSTMQRLKGKGLPIEEFTFTAQNVTKLTENLFTLFKDRRISVYHHEELVKELLSVVVKETGYGIRIDHASGAHDDHVISLGIAALRAASEPIHRPVTQEDFKSDAPF